ncbi:M23 family metallopeptidase [Agromyces bauzanensis]|nr:M23 family metallopeptidase [Agromyces bauzanensis]
MAPQGAAPQGWAPQGAAPQGASRPVESPPAVAPDPFGAGQPRAQRPGFDELFAAALHPAPPASHPTPAASRPAPPASHPTPASSHPTPAAVRQPVLPTPPTVVPTPPILGTPAASPAPRRRTANPTPLQTPEAEQTDRPVDRSSASAVSRRDSDNSFDALFAGLDDDDEFDEAPRGPGGRAARSGRASRDDRKAAKAAKAAKTQKIPKAAKPAKAGPPGPRRVGAMPAAPASAATDLAALVGGAAAGAPASPPATRIPPASPTVASAPVSVATPPASIAPASAPPASVAPTWPRSPAPAPLYFGAPSRPDSAELFAFATDAAPNAAGSATDAAPVASGSGTDAVADLFGFAADRSVERRNGRSASASAPVSESDEPTPQPTRRGDVSRGRRDSGPAAQQRPSRDHRRTQPAARDTAKSAGPRTKKVRVRVSTRPQSRPVASTIPSRRRGGRFLASVVAMSFAALLAVATTIPSLSLLSPADVQALAMSSTNAPGLDGQRVELNGDIVAQSVQREGYESQTIEEYARAAGIRPEATFTNNPAGTIQWPFAVGVHIGDRFGYRDCWGCSSNHGGQDFNPGLGAEIQAIADGVVSVSTDAGGSLGVVMMIDHMIDGELVTSVYAHMEYGSRRFEVGDTVHVADVVGTTGDSGMSTGPHLHFEIRIGGADGTKVDPLEWLYANTN